ncbi:AI-2E family transporter [Candidatus Woesearchaeota archaeon]|nr:AI-2E family transporter [Candidatus Woesearchaeota archaeon]
MSKIKSRVYPRIFFSALFIAALVLAFFITKPFIPALLTGAILAYLSYPLYGKVLAKVKNENVASFIVSLLVILLLTVPFILVIGLASKEAFDTYTSITQNGKYEGHDLGANFIKVVCSNKERLACRTVKFFTGFLPNKDIDYVMQNTIERITGFISANIGKLIASLPSIFLNLFVMAFAVYYLLKDGRIIAKRVKNLLPLKKSHKNAVFSRLHDVVYAVFYGNIAVAAIQGLLGGIGFLALGIENPVLWGFVMMLFALVPYFGAAIVWLPAALNLIFDGLIQNNNAPIIKGTILIFYGVLVISTMDNILKPKIIGDKARVHPILVLLGVLGGIKLFGFLGLILGPVTLALVIAFVEIYEEEKAEIVKYF